MDPSLTLECSYFEVVLAQLRKGMFLQCRWYQNLRCILHLLLMVLRRVLVPIALIWNHQRKDYSQFKEYLSREHLVCHFFNLMCPRRPDVRILARLVVTISIKRLLLQVLNLFFRFDSLRLILKTF